MIVGLPAAVRERLAHIRAIAGGCPLKVLAGDVHPSGKPSKGQVTGFEVTADAGGKQAAAGVVRDVEANDSAGFPSVPGFILHTLGDHHPVAVSVLVDSVIVHHPPRDGCVCGYDGIFGGQAVFGFFDFEGHFILLFICPEKPAASAAGLLVVV
jgi:hypothetical protein